MRPEMASGALLIELDVYSGMEFSDVHEFTAAEIRGPGAPAAPSSVGVLPTPPLAAGRYLVLITGRGSNGVNAKSVWFMVEAGIGSASDVADSSEASTLFAEDAAVGFGPTGLGYSMIFVTNVDAGETISVVAIAGPGDVGATDDQLSVSADVIALKIG